MVEIDSILHQLCSVTAVSMDEVSGAIKAFNLEGQFIETLSEKGIWFGTDHPTDWKIRRRIRIHYRL